MTLPAAAPSRRLKHRRSIDVQVFVRDDGLWEVDAELNDIKTRDTHPAGTLRPAGTPMHQMRLRMVVDKQLNIVAAGSETIWAPYMGHCNEHGDAYQQLIGLNLGRGFRAALREKLGGVLGCTHITELAQVLPTAVIQGFAGEVIDTRGLGDTRPMQIDRCHALRSDGDAVREFYPRWYRAAATSSD